MSLLDIGNNVRNFLRKKALDAGFKPLKDNSLGANLRGIGQAGQISTNFAQQKVNNFAQPAYNIPVAGGVLKGIVNQPFNYASSGAQFLQNPNIKTGSSFLGQGLNTASMFVAPTGLSFKAGQRVMPQIPSMAKNSFLKIGLPSGAGGALDTYGKGGNAGDIATSFAFNTAVGSGAGIGFPLAGRGIKNTFNGLRPSPKPVLMPRNNPFIANLGIKDRPLEVNPNLPARNYTTKPTPKKLMEPDDIYLLDELFNKDIRKEIGKDTTTNQLSQLMNRYFTKAEIDRIPKTDSAWRKALAKRANQTEDYFDNKAKNTNQTFLKISNPKSDPLTQEARKYKSAEEFVKAPAKEDVEVITTIKRDGTIGEGNRVVMKEKIKTKENAEALRDEFLDDLIKVETEIKEAGGREKATTQQLFRRTQAESAVKALDIIKDELPTKSQLTDIWNKANKPTVQPKIENPIQTPKMSVVNAEATPKTLDKIKIKDQKAQAKQAEIEFKEWQKQMFAREGATRTTTGAVRDASKLIGGNTRSMAAKDIAGLKDISSPATQFVDVFRNFKKVYGSKYEEVKKVVLDPLFVKGKTGMLDDQQMWIKKIDDFEKGFGIKKGSKQSADVQKYGEGLINEAGIVSKYGKKGAETIVEADKWFRKNYDQLLDEVNAVRAKIYPNNPDKIIPKRKDYYRHFNELSQGIDGLLNTLGRAIDVSPQLAGISYKTQPKSKWLSFAQKRIGSKTEYDAVGGFIDYVKAQTYAKHIDPHIDTFRQLGRELGETGVEEGKGLNNFGLFLEQFADNLSGKTNPADRFVQQLGGRKPMAVLNWVNQRVKANVILGNASSSIAQIFNLPNGIAEAGPKFATKGFGRAIASMFSPNKPQNQSVFLRERYFRGFEKFDRGMIDNGRKFAAWMITALDEVGTKSMWNMQYEKGLAQGLKGQALVNYADDVTRRMVAGRGIGEMALIQKSKAFQLVAPFQVEVTNAWYVIGDMIGEKAFGKLMTLALTTYVMNRAAEQIRGSDVSFDPIQATVEAIQAFNEEENKGVGAMRFAGRLGGEVISNVPFGQSAAAVYPEYGFMAGNTQYPTREQFFGKGDPTRFGSGLLATKGLQDPLFKILPPFGGQQIKRTIDGIDTTLKGYSQTPSGDVRFPAENSPVRSIQRAIFGEYSTPEAREYFDKNRSKLGSNQSEVFKNLSGADRENYYQGVLTKREKDKGVDELKTKEIEQSDIQNGPVINETLDRLVKSEYYQKLDEEGKYKAIDKAVANIRNQTKKTTNTETAKAPTAGQYEILNPETNKVKTIDIETPIEKPVLTGNTALDKKLISKFNSKLTSRGNDIVALYEDGQIDGKTAEAELAKLTTLRSSTAKAKKGKKPKKITIKKIAGAKKITNIKIAKSASLKPIKIKKLKLKSAKKVKKVGNIKIANYKLPKIKIS